eukprot:1156446-Pelagomonas_calceolata.AAC.2
MVASSFCRHSRSIWLLLLLLPIPLAHCLAAAAASTLRQAWARARGDPGGRGPGGSLDASRASRPPHSFTR